MHRLAVKGILGELCSMHVPNVLYSLFIDLPLCLFFGLHRDLAAGPFCPLLDWCEWSTG